MFSVSLCSGCITGCVSSGWSSTVSVNYDKTILNCGAFFLETADSVSVSVCASAGLDALQEGMRSEL